MRQSKSNRTLTIYLAYYIGSLLGDGSLVKMRKKGKEDYQYLIQFENIDRDFFDNINECLEKIVGRKSSVYEKQPRGISKRVSYFLRTQNKSLFLYLSEKTSWKNLIPDIIMNCSDREIIKHFVAGLMDTDGFITKAIDSRKNVLQTEKVGRGWQMTMGIGATNSWIFQLKDLMIRWGIGISNFRNEGLKGYGNKDMFYFTINKKSFIEKGFFFKIKRKQDRLKFYRDWFIKSSETIR